MKNIWTLIFGILMILGGVYALFNPLTTLVAGALYLGILFVAMGFAYLSTYSTTKSLWVLVLGIIDILIGIVFVTNLWLSAETLPFILALWALLTGIMQIVLSFQFKQEDVATWSWRLISGILGIIFALLILIYPILGVLTITALIGATLIIYGAFEVIDYLQTNKTV